MLAPLRMPHSVRDRSMTNASGGIVNGWLTVFRWLEGFRWGAANGACPMPRIDAGHRTAMAEHSFPDP